MFGSFVLERQDDLDHTRDTRGCFQVIANARSIRNALDRARLRQANRLFESDAGPLTAEQLSLISAEDILASRVFTQASLSPGEKS